MGSRRLKKYIRDAVVMIIVFVAAVWIFGYFTNKGNDDMTADMGTATFPQISFSYEGYSLNRLPGYSQEMDIAAVRDTITPVENGRLDINIESYDNKISSAVCGVYTLDGKEKLLSREVKDVGESISVEFPDVSVIGTERVLQIVLNSEQAGSVYYYTRIVDADGKNAPECLEYIRNFHENALDKLENVGIGTAIEPNEEGDNTTLQHVTIHSDYDHVTWGDLEPQVEGRENWLVKELNGVSCSVQLEYQVRAKGEENEEDAYKVKEFFRVRYRRESREGLLLDYDRTMQQILDPAQKVLGEKGIILGIADPNTPYIVNEDGTKAAFVQADELWHYNRDTDELSLVFSFASVENTDERNKTAQYKIELLSMDKGGDMNFAVYGYMNRGAHEGDVGAAIYHYNNKQNSVDERVFVSTRKSYGHALLELGRLVYYSEDRNVLYVLADGVLYEINVEKGSLVERAEGLKENRYVVSDDDRMIAYQTGGDVTKASKVQVIDLETGSEREVACEEGQSIQPLGFMQRDFVYGFAREQDSGTLVSGEAVAPMFRVEIQGSSGKILKTYEQKGIYVLSAAFQDNMITLTRATKKNNVYSTIIEDYITNNEEQEESNISLQSYTTGLKQTQMRIAYSDGIEDKEPKILRPRQTIRENTRQFSFDGEEENTDYCVYGYGELQGMYERAGDAVQQADLCGGVVLSPAQEYVWERGNRDLQYQIEGSGSVENLRSRLKAGTAPIDAVKETTGREPLDLTGCTVEELMYVINQDRPVIAMINAQKSVILTGYTETRVTYVETDSGKSHTVSVSELERMTEGSGGTYIA